MILPDVNMLIYAHNADDARYELANAWFQDLMTGETRACFCWETVNGFIRVSTNPRALPRPIPLYQAFSVVNDWLESANSLFLNPTSDHMVRLQQVAKKANARGPLFSDAILVTYAISHKATIASTDRDFRLFDGFRLFDPLSD